MLSASGPAAAAAPAAGAAKGAAGAGAASSLGATLASSLVPVALSTAVGGMMGGNQGAMAGLLGGILSQGTSQIMGGIFNKGAGAGKIMSPDVSKVSNLSEGAMPSAVPGSGSAALGSTVQSATPAPAAETVPSVSPFRERNDVSVSSTPAPQPSSGRVLAETPSNQTTPQAETQGSLIDKIFQQQRQLAEENYQRNLKSGMIGTATKGLMGGVSNYFTSKANEEEPTPYTGNMEAAIARGQARANERRRRQMALRQSAYPSLARRG